MTSRERDTRGLLLAVYDREDTAEHVFGVLRAQGEVLSASLDSAAIVRIPSDCGFTIIRTEHPRPSGSFWGVFWEALFGLIIRASAPALADSSDLAKLFATIERAGLDRRFRARARKVMQCGSSALALFALNWNAESLLNHFYLRPHVLVRASLSPQQHLELLRAVGGLPFDDASDVY
jgi:uncharacterized membrane protein